MNTNKSSLPKDARTQEECAFSYGDVYGRGGAYKSMAYHLRAAKNIPLPHALRSFELGLRLKLKFIGETQ